MEARTSGRSDMRWLAAGVALAAGAYAAWVGTAWYRYGQVPRSAADVDDPLLDLFMPACDIVERHHVQVDAPAALTLTAAGEADLFGAPVVRAIIRARELLLGARPDARRRPRGLLAEAESLGWVVLAEAPGREIVLGAVTQPWEADVTFRSVSPELFAAFNEPGYVKIAWTLRADPVGADKSIFRTETRAVATDPVARARFRRYWSFLSPGIVLIRRMSLGLVKAEAERRAHADEDGVPGSASRRLAHF